MFYMPLDVVRNKNKSRYTVCILWIMFPAWKKKMFLLILSVFFFPQINMYLLSRILFGLSRLAVEKGFIPQPKHDPFPLFATLVWGIVLWLFEYHPHTLQPSLQSSMDYLYHDSNTWHDITDFLIFNKPRTRWLIFSGVFSVCGTATSILMCI